MPANPRQVRKKVTALFADVVDSVTLSEYLGPEAWRGLMSEFYALAREVIEGYGGTVEKFAGDAVKGVFGVPDLHGDDALRAVQAAAELHRAVEDRNGELEQTWGTRLELHSGVNTGEVVVDPQASDQPVIADSVNVSARLAQAADAGEILMGDDTYRRVRFAVRARSVPALPLKGKKDPVERWRLISVAQPRRPLRFDAPIVGRDSELGLLLQAFRLVLDKRTSYMFKVTGTSGVGKSRLVNELAKRLEGEAMVLRGHCLPYGNGITFQPIRQILRKAAGIRRDDSPERVRDLLRELVKGDERATARLVNLLGDAGSVSDPEDSYLALRQSLVAIAERQPLMLVIDDLQWAQPSLLDLIERLGRPPARAPILVVCIARSELPDQRVDFGGRLLNAASLLLAPLRHDETTQMIGHLLEGGEADDRVVNHIQQLAGGNPLHVEELIALLQERDAIQLQDDSWTARVDLTSVGTAPTILDALAARLEQLDEPERLLLERAAVIGPQFRMSEVTALLPELDVTELLAARDALIDKDLLHQELVSTTSVEPEDPEHSFRHPNYQESAYGGLAREHRADLHERLAVWLDRRADNSPSQLERIGWHLSYARRDRLKARGGVEDDHARALALRSGTCLAEAGRAYVRDGAFPRSAENPLREAVLLLPESVSLRVNAMLDLADVLRDEKPDEARVLYGEVITGAKAARDRPLEHHALLGQLELQWLRTSRGDWLALDATVKRAVRVFRAIGDDTGLAKAWRVLAYAQSLLGEATQAHKTAIRARDAARRAGDRRLEAKVARLYCVLLFWGPTPVTRVEEEIRSIRDWSRDEGLYSVEAAALSILARTAAMQGQLDRARELNSEAEGIRRNVGKPELDEELVQLAPEPISVAYVELLAGRPTAAERALRAGYDSMEATSAIANTRATIASMLARALVRQYKDIDAERYVNIAQAVAVDLQMDVQIAVRSLRAILLARKGERLTAVRLAEEARELAERSGQPESQAEALVDQAEVLQVTGQFEAAKIVAGEALALYQRKGHVVAVRQVRSLIRDLDRHMTAFRAGLSGTGQVDSLRLD